MRGETLLSALCLMVLSTVLQAQTPAIQGWDETTGGSNDFPQFGSVGWQFDVNSEIVVDSLGLLDWNQDGFAVDQQVAIWDDAGNAILAQATITSASLLQGTTSNGHGFRYEAIAPVTLPVGRYRIAASAGATIEEFRQGIGGIVTAPEVAWIGGAVLQNTTVFGFPSTVTGEPPNVTVNTGLFGPNFTIAPASQPAPVPPSPVAVPGLSSPALMLLAMMLSAVGFLAFRRFS